MTSCDSVCETDLPSPSTLPDRKSARPVDTAIPDVQNTPDVRRIAIDKVGIKAIRHPVKVRDKSSGTQHTIATFGMYVHLPHHFKGAHMSRFIETSFPYFINKQAPVSGVKSLLEYEVTFIGEIRDGAYHQTVRFLVPCTSLCPCSKGISKYGAHNQRSHITITV